MNDRVTRAVDTAQSPDAIWSSAVPRPACTWWEPVSWPCVLCARADDGEHSTATLTWIEGSSGADS
jgi:hypothetical protein